MALPSAGQPISFGDINDELGNSTNATLDLKSASESLGESDAPFGMDELAGLSDDGITFSAFAAAQGSGQGEIDVSWTLSTPSGVTMATNGFILKGSANSDMSSPTTELQNSDGAGSPFTDTGLGANTTRYYRATTTTTAGTVTNSSIVNATTLQGEVDRAIGDIFTFNVDNELESTQKGWDTDELILCVENTIIPENDTTGQDPDRDTINLSAVGGFVDGNTATINGNQNFGDGSGISFTNNANFDGDGKFFRNNTDLKIHQIANNTGVISNTISFTPATLTISLVSKTTTSVTVRATGNTQVIDTLRFYRDTTEGTKTDHTKGAVGNTNVTADFTFSGLTANTSYAFKVRGENNSGTGGAVRVGSDSNTINVATDALPITISPTSVAGDTIADGTEVIAQIVTVTIASPSSPVIYVDNASNTRYKQATTSGGLSSASFTTPTTSTGGQSLTLSGGNQVFLQFEITNTSPVFNRTYTVKNGSDTETISVTEVER
jgi:hypothetical protein